MQSTAWATMGKRAIIYISVMFAVLHTGYKSAIDVTFVFGVGIFFSWIVFRTSSILGVTLAHGIANSLLFLVMPFTGFADAALSSPLPVPLAPPLDAPVSRPRAAPAGAPAPGAITRPFQTVTPAAPAVASVPLPAPAATPVSEPVQSVVPPAEANAQAATAPAPAAPVPETVPLAAPPVPPVSAPTSVPSVRLHVVARGESLNEIAAFYGVSVDALAQVNNVADRNQIEPGAVLTIPSGAVASLPVPRPVAATAIPLVRPATTPVPAPVVRPASTPMPAPVVRPAATAAPAPARVVVPPPAPAPAAPRPAVVAPAPLPAPIAPPPAAPPPAAPPPAPVPTTRPDGIRPAVPQTPPPDAIIPR